MPWSWWCWFPYWIINNDSKIHHRTISTRRGHRPMASKRSAYSMWLWLCTISSLVLLTFPSRTSWTEIVLHNVSLRILQIERIYATSRRSVRCNVLDNFWSRKFCSLRSAGRRATSKPDRTSRKNFPEPKSEHSGYILHLVGKRLGRWLNAFEFQQCAL